MQLISRNITHGIQLLLFSLFILSGCSGAFKFSKTNESQLEVPAGVDSTVAAEADSLADRLFVSIERENRSEKYKELGKKKATAGDTLWKYLSSDPDAALQVDSTAAIEAFNEGARNIQELAQLEANPNLSPALQQAEVLRLLKQARESFERAVVLNPFDAEAKSWLARVYQSLASRFLNEDDNRRAVNVLENLTRLEKGEHTLFARLAECYYALEEWPEANRNFRQAEQVLRNAAGLDFSETRDFTQDAKIDTAALFYYVYYQGDTEIKMHDAEAGLASLNRALDYASTAQERADIHSYIAWINWDDGNTRAVEKRDRYIALQEKGEYKKAADGFEDLLPDLRTERARDEIVWRLAVLEFQHLDRQEEGIERLKEVVMKTPQDETGAPVDSTYTKYFDSYGVMCHNLGLENFNKSRKVAFMYFKQAVTVDWENRAKSHLEIAKMSRNNPPAVIESCKQALATPEQLNDTELLQTYQLLVQGLKRTGKFDEARRYFAEWTKLRRSNLRSSR